jgi:hypothetical protein
MASEPKIGDFLIRLSVSGDLLESYLDPDTQEEVLADSGLTAEQQEILRSGDGVKILAALQEEYPERDVEAAWRPIRLPIFLFQGYRPIHRLS